MHLINTVQICIIDVFVCQSVCVAVFNFVQVYMCVFVFGFVCVCLLFHIVCVCVSKCKVIIPHKRHLSKEWIKKVFDVFIPPWYRHCHNNLSQAWYPPISRSKMLKICESAVVNLAIKRLYGSKQSGYSRLDCGCRVWTKNSLVSFCSFCCLWFL